MSPTPHGVVEPTSLTSSQRAQAQALVVVHQHLTAAYRPGAQIAEEKTADAARVLATRLGLPATHVAAALSTLNTRGVVAIRRAAGVVLLASGQPHPDDHELHQAVRDRISSGYYPPDSAIPTGLLGDEFGLASSHVRRACLHLTTADGTLRWQARGPYGPGFYVPGKSHPAKEHQSNQKPVDQSGDTSTQLLQKGK